jgi:phage-related protein
MKANPLGIIITAVAGLAAAFVVLWNKCEGFRNFFKGMINGIITGINALIKGLNKLKVDIPDWVPGIGGGKLGFNIPLIPKLAKGGIVDKATLAMVGEAGKEAVMPLERNTQWIDQLAEKLSAKGGSKTTNNTINNYFEKMETSRHALHKANLETKRILTGV